MREGRKRRLPLSRGGRTACNLALCALLVLYFWGAAGYPLFSNAAAFRRMEETQLLRSSRMVWEFPAGNSRWLWSAENGVLHLWRAGDAAIQAHTLPDGGGLIPLTEYAAGAEEIFFLAAGVPEEAFRAELTFARAGSGPAVGFRFHAPGKRLEGFGFLFRVDVGADSGSAYTAEARFYDRQDREVARLVFR